MVLSESIANDPTCDIPLPLELLQRELVVCETGNGLFEFGGTATRWYAKFYRCEVVFSGRFKF